MLTYRNAEGECKLYSNLANRGGPACLASNRRIDVPEKVGGPALCVKAEGLGRDRDGELFSDGRRGGSPAIPFKVNDGSVDSASAYTMTSNVTPVNDPAMGTRSFIISRDLVTGQIVEPYGGPRRTEADFLQHVEAVIASDRVAQRWHFVVDNLDTHRSESLVRWVARESGLDLNQSQGGNYILERWQRHGRCKHQCVGSGL